MKRPILIASLSGTIILLGYVGIRHESNAELQRGISNFYAHLPPGVSFTYRKAYPRILSRGAGFTDVRISNESGNEIFTARRLLVNAPSGAPRTGMHFASLTFIAPQFEVLGGETPVIKMNAASVHLKKVTLPPVDAASSVEASLAALKDIQMGEAQAAHLDGAISGLKDGNSLKASCESLDLKSLSKSFVNVKDVENLRFERAATEPGDVSSSISVGYIKDYAFYIPNQETMTGGMPYSSFSKMMSDPRITGAKFGPIWINSGPLEVRVKPFSYERKRKSPTEIVDRTNLQGVVLIKNRATPGEDTKLNFDVRSSIIFNVPMGKLEFRSNIVSPELGKLDFATKWIVKPSSKESPESKIGVQVTNLETSFQDHGLLNYVYTLTAHEQGITEDQVRSYVSRAMSNLKATTPELGALSQFTNQPDRYSLVIKFQPLKPLDLSDPTLLQKEMTFQPQSWLKTGELTIEAVANK